VRKRDEKRVTVKTGEDNIKMDAEETRFGDANFSLQIHQK
jgi:hypothetical protein